MSGVDARYVTELGQPMADIKTSALNTAGTRLSVYPCPECSVANASANLSSIAAMNLTMISKISGSQCDGVLGMDFLHQHVISIDLDKKVMTISEDVPENVQNRALAVPLQPVFNGHVAVDAMVNQMGIRMMIDTGDSGSITLNPADWKRAFAWSHTKVRSVLSGDGSSHSIQMLAARVNSMDLLSNHYENLVAAMARNPVAPSTLGLKFLRRHIVTLDFPDQTLFLQPSSRFGELESTDMSGLHIVRQGPDIVVYAVDEGSPAAQAKLSAGDIIESINGKEAATLTLWEIRRALKAEDNRIIEVGVKRGALKEVYKFALRSTL